VRKPFGLKSSAGTGKLAATLLRRTSTGSARKLEAERLAETRAASGYGDYLAGEGARRQHGGALRQGRGNPIEDAWIKSYAQW
jgi:hypothetical protein